MDRLPEIGERVRFRGERMDYRTGLTVERTVTGAVRRLYPGSRCVDPDDEDSPIVDVRVGSPGWAEHWSAAVEVDEVPEWWPYSGTNLFAPPIANLEPES